MDKLKAAVLTTEWLWEDLPKVNREACQRGGLGILARDFLAGMPDAGIDGTGFLPLYHRSWKPGYKNQELRYNGTFVTRVPTWFENQQYDVTVLELKGSGPKMLGLECPQVLDVLYTDESRWHRLRQEAVFAQAVYRTMKAINYHPDVVWQNEAHTGLINAYLGDDPEYCNTNFHFTTHSPEESTFERFFYDNLWLLCINPERWGHAYHPKGLLDLPWGAMALADSANGVSMEHTEVSKNIFAPFQNKIRPVTNGTDLNFWRFPELAEVCKRGLPITTEFLVKVHRRARDIANLFIQCHIGTKFSPDKPLIGLCRRFQEYKDIYPALQNIVYAICADRGTVVETVYGPLKGLGLQVLISGLAPESDNVCQSWFREFTRLSEELYGRFAFLQDYSLELLQIAAWGLDLGLVMPKDGREACGTSCQRWLASGVPVAGRRTGGWKEYGQQFDPETLNGNGFIFDTSLDLYRQLALFSDVWYGWRDQTDPEPWGALLSNAFQSGCALDIRQVLSNGYLPIFRHISSKGRLN